MIAAQAPDIETLAKVIEAHNCLERGRVYDRCACGWYGHGHSDHLAAVLAAGFVRPEDVAEAQAKALEDAADEVRRVRENGLPEGVNSHPTAEHFEDWLRDRAAALRPVDAPEGGQCANFLGGDVTCLTALVSVTARCDFCKARAL